MSNTIYHGAKDYFLNVVCYFLFLSFFLLHFVNATQNLSDVWKCLESDENVKQKNNAETDSTELDGLRIIYDNPSGIWSFTYICDSDTTYLMFNLVLTHEDDLFLYLELQNEPCLNIETK